MKIIFDKQAGETLDLLWSLFYTANFEYVRSEIKRAGIEPDEKIDKVSQQLINHKKININMIKHLFNNETNIADALLPMNEVFGKDLQECLSIIESMKKEEIIQRIIVNTLSTAGKFKDKTGLQKEAQELLRQNKVIAYINDLHISDGAKWRLFCFLENAEYYAKEAAELLRNYAPIYYKVIKKQEKHISRFIEEINARFKADEEDFFYNLLRRNLNQEGYENIYITTTYLHYYSLYFHEAQKSAFIILGVNYEKYMNKLQGEDDIDRNLNIFKNLSDKTRFEIVKMLLSKDYFGVELAEALEISTATISYHMNNLYASHMVNIIRKDHKAFYTLNKETIRGGINFLYKEFEL